MKELREFIRYPVDSANNEPASVEIDGERKIYGIITDLSTGGLSFYVDISNAAADAFDLEKFLFIRINIQRFSINAQVEKKWSLVKNADNKKIYCAGAGFKVISNEDRLRLNEIIEYLRSESSACRSSFINQL